MFTKILIANRGVLAHGQAKQNGRAADVSTKRLPQTAQRAATRHTIA
jgi:hypothetical protein